MFAGQQLSPAAMERLEQRAQASHGLLEGTVVLGDLQRMQNTCPNPQPLSRILTTSSGTVPAAPPSFSRPPPSSQRRVDLVERDIDILVDICHRRQRQYSQLKRGEKGPF